MLIYIFLLFNPSTLATGKLTFGQVPLYEEPGFSSVQSGAIVRYLAKKHGLAGNNDLIETAQIDATYEGAIDLLEIFLTWRWRTEESKKEALQQTILKESLPTQLGHFTTLLEKNGNNGFTVGSKVDLLITSTILLLQKAKRSKTHLYFCVLFCVSQNNNKQITYADFALYAALTVFHELPGAAEVISSFPAITKFHQAVASRDRIQAYIARNVYAQTN